MTMQVRPRDVRWRLAAFLCSFVPIFGFMLPLQYVLGDDSRLVVPITAASYAVLGAFLGFYFPGSAWEAALWLIGLFIVLAIANAVFVNNPPPWVWSREMKGLLEYGSFVAAAVFGIGFGRFLRRRSNTDLSRPHN